MVDWLADGLGGSCGGSGMVEVVEVSWGGGK